MRIGMIWIPIPVIMQLSEIVPIPIRIRIYDHADSNSNSFWIRLIGKINDSDSDSNFCGKHYCTHRNGVKANVTVKPASTTDGFNVLQRIPA